jgi:hypothetical protein
MQPPFNYYGNATDMYDTVGIVYDSSTFEACCLKGHNIPEPYSMDMAFKPTPLSK